MDMIQRYLSLLICLLLPATTAHAVEDALWKALHDGGNVLLMRHATTEKVNDPLLFEPDNCIFERDLSDQGVTLVLKMALALRKHDVPIGEVYSSRFCRAINTAWITYDKVELWAPLDLIQGLDEQQANQRMDKVAERIVAYKGKENMVMVTHSPNINHLTLELIPYAGMVVLRPDGQGDFDVLGTISPNDIFKRAAVDTHK